MKNLKNYKGTQLSQNYWFFIINKALRLLHSSRLIWSTRMARRKIFSYFIFSIQSEMWFSKISRRIRYPFLLGWNEVQNLIIWQLNDSHSTSLNLVCSWLFCILSLSVSSLHTSFCHSTHKSVNADVFIELESYFRGSWTGV